MKKIININGEKYDDIWVVSDIHGDAEHLFEAVEALGINAPKTMLIIAGDLIDRGNEVDRCLDFIEMREKLLCEVIYLKGNHEDMLSHYIADNYAKNILSNEREKYRYNTIEILRREGASNDYIIELGKKLSNLPILAEIDYPDRIVRIGHAEVPESLHVNSRMIIHDDIVWGQDFFGGYYAKLPPSNDYDGKKIIMITGHIRTEKINQLLNTGSGGEDDYKIFCSENNGNYKYGIDCGNGYRNLDTNYKLAVVNISRGMKAYYF